MNVVRASILMIVSLLPGALARAEDRQSPCAPAVNLRLAPELLAVIESPRFEALATVTPAPPKFIPPKPAGPIGKSVADGPKPKAPGVYYYEKGDTIEHIELVNPVTGKPRIQFEGQATRSFPLVRTINSKFETMGGRALIGDRVRLRGYVDVHEHLDLVHNTEVLVAERALTPELSEVFYGRVGLRFMDVQSAQDFRGSVSMEGVVGLDLHRGKKGVNATFDFAAGPAHEFSAGPVKPTYWGEIYLTY